MGEVIPINGRGGAYGHRIVETAHSDRQRVIKKVARSPKIKALMKELVQDSGNDEPTMDNRLNQDTYGAMRELANGIKIPAKKGKAIELSDAVVADGLFLSHFHALQGMILKHGEDSWDEDIKATAAWPYVVISKEVVNE